MAIFKFVCRIIVKGKLIIPENKIHFHVKGWDGNDYTDIPFNNIDMEDIGDNLKNYENINEIHTQSDPISKKTKELIKTIRELGLRSFLLESFIYYGDSYPIADLISIVIDKEKIIQESLLGPVDKNTGDRYKDIYGYEYDDILYHNYELAQLKYQKELENKQP